MEKLDILPFFLAVDFGQVSLGEILMLQLILPGTLGCSVIHIV